MNRLSKSKFYSSAINDRVRKCCAADSLKAGLLGLALAVILTTMEAKAYAGEFQVLSVNENSVGAVIATIAIFTGEAPAASAFKLKFDDKTAIPAKEVKPATTAELPTSIILCVDQSSSMSSSHIRQIQEALRGALGKSESQLNLALCAFDTEVRKLHGFSKDTAQLARGISEIGAKSTRNSSTKLYEAIELGLSELRSRDDKGLKRLIVITDGRDVNSSISASIIASPANAQGIAIDTIGFGNVAKADAELLARIASDTGGHFVLVGNAKQLSGELHKLFNLPPPRMFDISFLYSVTRDGHKIHSAQLEYIPKGRAPTLQTITYGLSMPVIGKEPSHDPSDKWTINLLSFNVDLATLLGIVLVGVVALLVVYKIIVAKKRPPQSQSNPTPPPQKPTVTPRDIPPPKRPKTAFGFAFPAPNPGNPAAILHCLAGPAKGRKFFIEKAIYRIGSGEGNELQISDDYLSNKHAIINYDSGNLYLCDNSSRNGTFLDEERLDQTARALAPGNHIRVGKSTLELAPPGREPAPQQATRYVDQTEPPVS